MIDFERDGGDALAAGVESENEVACFVALQATSLGHSMPLICRQGFGLLETLANRGQYEMVVECLYSVAPLFFTCPKEATSSKGFSACLLALVEAEATVLRKAKGFVVQDFPGQILRDLAGMVQKHISSHAR